MVRSSNLARPQSRRVGAFFLGIGIAGGLHSKRSSMWLRRRGASDLSGAIVNRTLVTVWDTSGGCYGIAGAFSWHGYSPRGTAG